MTKSQKLENDPNLCPNCMKPSKLKHGTVGKLQLLLVLKTSINQWCAMWYIVLGSL